MLATYIQEGKSLTWLNSTGVAVANKAPIVFGLWCLAIALVDIAIAATGSVQVEGVWQLPKAAGVINQGGKVWWDATAEHCLNAPALNSYFLGYATEAALTGDTTVNISIEEFCYEGTRLLTLAATGSQTLNIGDFASGDLILLCPNTATQTINLPATATIPIGATLVVKKTDATAAAITLDPYSSEQIAGGANFATIDALNDTATFVNTGTAWALLGSVIA